MSNLAVCNILKTEMHASVSVPKSKILPNFGWMTNAILAIIGLMNLGKIGAYNPDVQMLKC
jgi:hypothetical protein